MTDMYNHTQYFGNTLLLGVIFQKSENFTPKSLCFLYFSQLITLRLSTNQSVILPKSVGLLIFF